MSTPVRILIATASEIERTSLEALLDSADLDLVRKHEPLERAVAALEADAEWDLVLAACPAHASQLAESLQTMEERIGRLPLVLMASELSEDVALLAHRLGARVCLFAHGPTPLRYAVLAAAQQATERRERRLSDEAKERVRALVHSSVSDVVFHIRVEGDRFRFVEVNPAFLKATGLRQDQVVGKLVHEVIPEPSSSLVLSKYRQAIAEGRTIRWQEITPYPAGERIGEVSVTPVLDAQGHCLHLVGTVQDVTEVREQTEAIRLYADIVRNVQIGLTVWRVPDAQDPATVTLAAFNPAAAQLLGLELAPVVGRPLAEIHPGKRGLLLLDLIGRVVRDGSVHEAPAFGGDDGACVFAVKGFPLPGACVGLAIEDVTVQARAYDQLRQLSGRIDAAREEERTGIARELHDQLGQALTVLKMDLAWIARRASSDDGLTRVALLEKLTSMIQMSDEVIEEVRRISAELRPALLDQVGLPAALAWKAQEFATRTQIACLVESNIPDTEPLDRSLATAVFRVFQEALTNVVRHAKARRVDVSLDLGDASLVLQVRDDGRGITADEIDDPRSLGLLGIRERARRLGGDVTFARAAPSGTLVTLRLPVGA
jgi:PAS domain S-box-containing protein